MMSSCVFIRSNKSSELTQKPTKIFIFIDGELPFAAGKHTDDLLAAFEEEMKALLSQRKIKVKAKSYNPLSLDQPAVAQKQLDAFAPSMIMRTEFKNSDGHWNVHTTLQPFGQKQMAWRSVLSFGVLILTPTKMRRCANEIVSQLEKDSVI